MMAPMLCLGTITNVSAQEDELKTDESQSSEESATEEELIGEVTNETEKLDPNKASIRTRPDARTMTLSIPAPRGQITDRFG